jgi:hypothetical protein
VFSGKEFSLPQLPSGNSGMLHQPYPEEKDSSEKRKGHRAKKTKEAHAA